MKRNEAIDRLRQLYLDATDENKAALECLIPELAESEDERIRKEIIDIVEAYRANCVYEGTHRFDDCIAYLEKQKEPENVSASTMIPSCWEEKQKEQELSTPEDIAAAYQMGLAKGRNEQKPVKLNDDTEVGLDYALQIVKAAKGNLCGYQSDDGIYECDHAIQTLERILKNGIEQKPAEGTALQKAFISSKIDYTLEEKCDASDYADAILPTSVAYGENEEEYKLHKIIEAAFIAGQKKKKNPTDRAFTFDDVLALESAMALAKDDKKLHGALKSIFERVHDAYHGEQKPAEQSGSSEKPKDHAEWSEEDEEMYARVVRRYTDYEGVIMRTKEESVANKMLDAMAQEEIWLKSFRPQPHWKPSKEQIYSLGTVVKGAGENSVGSIAYNLKELYEELKKL